MKIRLIKSQFGLEETKIYSAEDYGDFYIVVNGVLTVEVEKINAEVVA
jgi:hypothetical protein